MRPRAVTRSPAWTGNAQRPGPVGRTLTYVNAARRYPDYLGVMHAVAEAGQFSPEQLEFFVFSLGEAF